MNSTVLKNEPPVQLNTVEPADAIPVLHTATLVGLSDGKPLLKMAITDAPVRAIAQTTQLTESEIGSQFIVMLDCGNPARPIVIGKLASEENANQSTSDRFEIEAEEELVLKCGKACIKMTSDGTVAIRGANVVTRASHTNRIRGGNVQIN